MSAAWNIRFEARGDEDAIRQVVARAFDAHPHSDGSEPAIVDRLRDRGTLALSLVAVEGDVILGHVAFSSVWIEKAQGDWYGLAPVSVRPDRQLRGIGSTLIEAGLDEIKARNAAGCVLLGEPGFYARFGFRWDPELVYPGAPDGYFQRLVFRGAVPTGQVRYDAAFDVP